MLATCTCAYTHITQQDTQAERTEKAKQAVQHMMASAAPTRVCTSTQTSTLCHTRHTYTAQAARKDGTPPSKETADKKTKQLADHNKLIAALMKAKEWFRADKSKSAEQNQAAQTKWAAALMKRASAFRLQPDFRDKEQVTQQYFSVMWVGT